MDGFSRSAISEPSGAFGLTGATLVIRGALRDQRDRRVRGNLRRRQCRSLWRRGRCRTSLEEKSGALSGRVAVSAPTDGGEVVVG